MSDFLKAFERFLFRDLSFIVGGAVVLGSGMYVCGRFPTAELPAFAYFVGAGVAYAIGYAIQEFSTIFHLVRTKAGFSPNLLGKALYRCFDRKAAVAVDATEYEEAKKWLYEAAPQRFRDDHERIESLKQVGTALGPSFVVAAAILLSKNWLSQVPFELVAASSLAGLGLALWLLGWLKVTQQPQYLIARFRAFRQGPAR